MAPRYQKDDMVDVSAMAMAYIRGHHAPGLYLVEALRFPGLAFRTVCILVG